MQHPALPTHPSTGCRLLRRVADRTPLREFAGHAQAPKPWPKEEHGKFYKGDSYIVLHTHKEDGSTKLLYDLYFWLGQVRA